MNNWNNIPENFQSENFWLTWHFEAVPGQPKPIKKPNISPGPWDNKKYYSFPAVLNEFNRCQLPDNQSRADGIGIAFTTENDIIGIDIDNIDDHNIPAEIKAILLAGKSGYIEKSVSQHGYHIIGTTNNKELLLTAFKNYNNGTGGKSKDRKVELYIANHYFTVSGYTVNNNFGNIDLSIALAFEYVTNRPLINSVAGKANSVASITNNSVAGIDNQRSGTIQNSVASFPPCPQNAFTDEEIDKLKLMPFAKAVEFMYKGNSVLKQILTIDGIEEDITNFQSNDKDASRSGIDMEIISSVVFWLKRYKTEKIVEFLLKSKINRTDKHDISDYFTRTVETAKRNAIEFFPATYGLKPADWEKLKNWQAWKRDCVKAIKEIQDGN